MSSFLSCTLAFNRGISFGFFDDATVLVSSIIYLVISCIVTVLVVTAYYRWQERLSIVGESLIIVGSLSNMIDRLLYGAVIDFILIHYHGWELPVFNIADCCITVGVVLILVRNYSETDV